jgi:hypothetical protein
VVDEELANMAAFDVTHVYPRVQAPVLVLRAMKPLLTDFVFLPDSAKDELQKWLPQAEVVDLPDANHYSIVFQPHAERDRVLRDFFGPY